MTKYEKINVLNLNEETINLIYKNMLEKKLHFTILKQNKNHYVLTKEKSIFEIKNEKHFVKKYEKNKFYKTVVLNEEQKINKEDLNLFFDYINKFKDKMMTVYGDKYLFGSIAVKTDNGFITTLRGKENLDSFVLVKSVDHKARIIYTINNKATLNAPLLDNCFKNKKIKAIVHLNHNFDKNLKTYSYAFPGTKKDSLRTNKTSFNIAYHGLIYLFDENGNLL